jgi:hypothetical protein
MTIDITEGWTQELPAFTLRMNGAPIELTGMTVALIVKPKKSNIAIDTSGDTRIDPDQSGAGKGKVYYKPDATDVKATRSPYLMRWKITDSAGNVVFAPHAKADVLNVHKQ